MPARRASAVLFSKGWRPTGSGPMMSKSQSSAQSSKRAPHPTNHGILRWQIRGNQLTLSMDVVWNRAQTVQLQRPHGFHEIRFDKQSDTLLCRKNDKLVTVLYAKPEPLFEPVSSEEKCTGCGKQPDFEDGHCPICGAKK